MPAERIEPKSGSELLISAFMSAPAISFPDVIRFTYAAAIMFMNLTCFVNYSVTRHVENRRASEVAEDCSPHTTKNKIKVKEKILWRDISL